MQIEEIFTTMDLNTSDDIDFNEASDCCAVPTHPRVVGRS